MMIHRNLLRVVGCAAALIAPITAGCAQPAAQPAAQPLHRKVNNEPQLARQPADPIPTSTVSPQTVKAFLADLATKAAVADKAGTTVVKGKDGWLFFGPELRHLSAGPFWGPAAVKVSHATNPDWADPLPAILDFKSQLDKAGIQLIMVPVPAKATIFPEMVSDAVHVRYVEKPPRLDVYDQQFYGVLGQHGIKVLDLTSEFLQHRSDKGFNLYCQQDTHWSGYACQMAARIIAEQIEGAPWFMPVPKHNYGVSDQRLSISGDLWTALNNAALRKEEILLTFVKETTAAGSGFVEPWRESPVLLLGDSHNLIFHAGGDMQAEGAGLPDQLAKELGFPVDLVAVRGSGATPARMNLFRRRDHLAGKKVVIWCFTVREFTEGQGWRKVPIIK